MRPLLPTVALIGLLGLAACAMEPARNYLVFFPTDGMTLGPDGTAIVGQVAQDARARPGAMLVVEGEADGGSAHDLALANDRGAAVAQALAAAGVSPSRIRQQPGIVEPGHQGLAAHKVTIRFE